MKFKKILSLALAAVMLLAAVPIALAEGAAARSGETEKLDGGEMPAVQTAEEQSAVKAPMNDAERSLFTHFNSPGTYVTYSCLSTYGWTDHNNPNLSGDGDYVQSGNTGVAGSSAIFFSEQFSITSGETIKFDYFYDTEPDQDIFYFLVNGVEQFRYSGSSEDWHSYTWTAPSSGRYQFEWAYIKDGSYNVGQDCVKLANMTYVRHEAEYFYRAAVAPGCGTLHLQSTVSDAYPFKVETSDVQYHELRVVSTNYHVPNSRSEMTAACVLPDQIDGVYALEFACAFMAEHYDKFRLYDNDELVLEIAGDEFGDNYWYLKRHEIRQGGEHVFRFVYQKDGSIDEGWDMLRIDNIKLVQSSDYEDRYNALDMINADNTQSHLIFHSPKGPEGFDLFYNIQGQGVVVSNNFNVDNSVSYMETFVNMTAGETLEFDYAVTSENTYDGFVFRANGTTELSVSGWADDRVAIGHYTFTAPQSRGYNFRWEYEKDGSTSRGDDRVIIHNVKYTGTRNNELTLDSALNVFGGDLHFETGDYNDFNLFTPWETATWVGARSRNMHYEGAYSLVETEVTVNAGDRIEFEYFVKIGTSEDDGFDFRVNNRTVMTENGDHAWQDYSYTFEGSGTFNLCWIYRKYDETSDPGDDYVMLDEVALIRQPYEPLDLNLINANGTQRALNFNTYDPYPFEVLASDTGYYAQSSNAGVPNSESFITADTVMLPAGSKIEFDYFVKSEENYDMFEFYVNGTEVHHDSGNAGNQHYTYTVPAQDGYTFHWKYRKDSSQNSGEDCVRISNVKITLGGSGSFLLGDVNNDGSVTVSDAILTLRIALGLLEPTADQRARADMNGDGDVVVADAILVLRKSMGL